MKSALCLAIALVASWSGVVQAYRPARHGGAEAPHYI
jgi:hypothetical protein